MKFLITSLSLLIVGSVTAQVAVSSYNIYNDPAPATTDNSAMGWINASAPYNNGTTYSLHYGKLNAATNGTTREITDFNISSGPSAGTYVPVPFSGNQPFDTIIVQRKDNAYTTGRRVNALYELGSFDGGTNSLYLQPQYNETMEDIINRKYLNVGSDNTFVNDNSSTTNNIERLDLIFSNGITAGSADLAKVGILINERGGNDYFKIAAITSIDGNKNVTGLGSLVSITPSTWGNAGPAISTVVMSREEADLFLRPKEDIGAQTISGVFISLADLGITSSDTYIRGVSLFPNDVNATMDLLGLTDVPTNTSGGAVGGLDLMAGGGFFREVGTFVILPIQFIQISGQLTSDNRARINWTVNTDVLSHGHFVIERSANNSNWQEIGRVEYFTSGNSSYTFVNDLPLQGTILYRIKLTNAHGKTIYSKTVAVSSTSGNKPAIIQYEDGSDHVWINTGNPGGAYQLRFIDFYGRLLKTDHASYQGNSMVKYDLGDIPVRPFIMQLIQHRKIVANQKIMR